MSMWQKSPFDSAPRTLSYYVITNNFQTARKLPFLAAVQMRFLVQAKPKLFWKKISIFWM